MKTRDLIAKLQGNDPGGNAEVCFDDLDDAGEFVPVGFVGTTSGPKPQIILMMGDEPD